MQSCRTRTKRPTSSTRSVERCSQHTGPQKAGPARRPFPTPQEKGVVMLG